jgi:hypothetical protein
VRKKRLELEAKCRFNGVDEHILGWRSQYETFCDIREDSQMPDVWLSAETRRRGDQANQIRRDVDELLKLGAELLISCIWK